MVQTGLVNAVVTGIVTGSIVALGAIGLALVYSIAEVPNFAHGELLTIGAYTAFLVNKPGVVPGVDLATSGQQVANPAALSVLFVLTAGSSLGIVYHLGGRSALEGDWLPLDVPPAAGFGLQAAVAVLLGALVLLSTPSVLGGLLVAALAMAAFTPMLEKLVFRKFRDKGVELATMLIVALGLSFVLRFTTQALFTGQVRSYVIPGIATIGGVDVPLSAAQFFDVYATGGGLVVTMINTGAVGSGISDRLVGAVAYGWPLVALWLVATVGVAAAAYRWRRGADGFNTGQTFGPRLTAAIAGVGVFAVLGVVLSSGAGVPETSMAATRIKLSLVRGATILIAVAMMVMLHLLLKETKLGTAMRASSDNIDLAKVTGINTDRVMMATWIIAGAYAAVGGVMLGILFPKITPNMGFFLLLPMFAGVILGGVGSVYGAIVGSFVVGLSMDVGFYLLPVSAVHRVSIAFVVLLVVLLVKPEGITGGT